MSPDRTPKRAAPKRRAARVEVRTKPSSDDKHDIVYYKRHKKDDPAETIPAREFLQRVCPPTVRAKLNATLVAVASAPPKRFSGGGRWEAMRGDMTGWFEARADGPQRHHYRLYCRLDYDANGRDKPLLAIIGGLDKPFRTELPDTAYKAIRDLGDEYLSRNPRSVA